MDSATYKDFGVCLSKFSDYFARWIDGNLMKLEFADMAGLDAQCCEFDVSLQYPKNVSSKGTASEVGYTDGGRVCFWGSARPGSGLARPGSAQFGSARLGSAQLGSARLGPARPGPARPRAEFMVKTYVFEGYTDGRRVCFGGRPGLARLSSAQPGLARLSSARLGHKMDPTWMEEQTRLPHYGRKFT